MVASPKAEGGSSLAEYTRKSIQYYRSKTPSATMTAIGTTLGGDGHPLPLYQLKPGPKTPPHETTYQSSVFIEDQHCFIDVYFSAYSQQVHDANLPLFKRFVSQFRKK